MNTPAILVEHLSKKYRLGELEPYKTLRDSIANVAHSSARALRGALSRRPTARPDPRMNSYIWALRDVSLEVKKGEIVGIIGPNGAGKTTLLKVLSRITEPTLGRAEIHGRVGSLLEVGTGFHQELTGRENVYLNGAILGMKKAEIDEKFEEIVGFSELQQFIDTPVKRYSDGMRVRLGFAIAAHLETEILLVDEVLAVGDAAFQRKSLGKMGEVTGEGRTIIFVSHDMAAIQNLCSKAYALSHGSVLAAGEVGEVISRYLDSVSRPQTISLMDRPDRRGTGKLRLVGFSIRGATNSHDTVQCGAQADFVIAYEGSAPLRNAELDMLFYNQFGSCVLVTGSGFSGKVFEEVPERGAFVCRFDRFPVMPGVYHLRLDATVNGLKADDIKDAVTLHVVGGDFYGSGRLPPTVQGYVATPQEWEVEERPS